VLYGTQDINLIWKKVTNYPEKYVHIMLYGTPYCAIQKTIWYLFYRVKILEERNTLHTLWFLNLRKSVLTFQCDWRLFKSVCPPGVKKWSLLPVKPLFFFSDKHFTHPLYEYTVIILHAILIFLYYFYR